MGFVDDVRARLTRWAMDSEDDVSPEDMAKALSKAGYRTAAQPTREPPRSMFHDPYSILDWGGWRERPSAITYETLRQMSIQATPIQSILTLRRNQISQFCRPQQGEYDKGFRIMLRDRRNNRSMTQAEIKQAAEIERMLETTGYLLPHERPTSRDSFRTFVKKSINDILVFDQWAFEKQRDRFGKVSRFIALDGSSIRPAVADVEHMTPQEHQERVTYVQVYENTVVAEYTDEDIAWCIMNPRTDLRVNGFGFSPIEGIVQLVTAWLFGFQYNQKFFCISGDSLIHTDEGLRPLASLVGESFRVWDGQGWHAAEAVETGHRELCRTRLKNGLVIESSPHHLFRGVRGDGDGVLEWIRQDQLVAGEDMVAVDTAVVDPPLDLQDLLVGKTYESDRSTGSPFTVTEDLIRDPELWEMLGFSLGDGHWERNKLQVFPHYEKDAELFTRFKDVCHRHGIQVQDGLVRGGEKQYPCLRMFHTTFMEWLQDIGFKFSFEGKRIPETLFSQPAWVRSALLRGLFSADGHTQTHKTGYRTPTVCVVDDVLRHDVLRCLLSVGVASAPCGKKGTNRFNLRAQDVSAFCERVGYLQDYKNENISRSAQVQHKWDLVHPMTSANIVEQVRTHEKWLTLPMKVRRVFYSAALGSGVVSRPRLREALTLLGEPIPEELQTIMVEVENAETTGVEIPMYDVIVHNDRHLFFANGAAVHNTQGSAIKGLINIKGAIPDKQMRAFRRMWYTMISGVGNAWRTPILNAEEIQWQSMHSSNREMEFSAWMDWLTKLICAVYGTDPTEINFQFGNTGQSGSPLQEGSQEDKIKESKARGLRPLVDHLTDHINSHIVWDLCPDFEFAFSGLDAHAEESERKALIDEVQYWKTIDEIRAKKDLPPLPNGAGQIILNSNFKQDEGEGEGGGDEVGADFDPFGEDDDDLLVNDGNVDDVGSLQADMDDDDDLLAASFKDWKDSSDRLKKATAALLAAENE